MAQACAHNHPRTPKDEALVVGWLKAAAIIAGVDPLRYGLLATHGTTLPLPRRQEGFLCHLGDHDWVLAVPAVQWLVPELKTIALRDYKIASTDTTSFNFFRNYIFSQGSALALYETFATQGRDALTQKVHQMIIPA